MKFFRFILLLAHTQVLALMALMFLNRVVPPSTTAWLGLIPLIFPLLFGLNLLLMLIWTLLGRKRVFLFLLMSVPLLMPLRKWINYTTKLPEKPELKVMTYNAKNCADSDRAIINDYINAADPDILFLQETGPESESKPLAKLKYTYLSDGLVGIYSKYPILAEGVIPDEIGRAMYADINLKGKTVRFVNVYMNPFSIEKSLIEKTTDVDTNLKQSEYVLSKLLPNFVRHQKHIEEIRPYISHSPCPVILGGDFNSVPESYEYNALSAGLHDAFVEAGRGSATSFHDWKYPLRIDYLFSSPKIKAKSYHVDRGVNFSDHFPVTAEFTLE